MTDFIEINILENGEKAIWCRTRGVNAVAPGLVQVDRANVNESYRKQFVNMVPSGRVGHPADIAGVVLFLVSPAAAYVNGECIIVDGGFLTGRMLQNS